MQQTLPANLQYYQKSGGYVPPHIQQQMAQHMQKSMPEHLKQYVNPYMQQNVVSQHLTSAPTVQPTSFTPHPPSSFTPNQQSLRPSQVQPPITSPPQSTPTQIQNGQVPGAVAELQTASPPEEPYAFITNPEVAAKPSLNLLALLNGKSLRTRVIALGGGLVGLLIIFSILQKLFAGSFDLQPFLVVLHDQQELIHLTSEGQSGQSALPATYQNFLATTQVTVTSAQSQLITYLTKNQQKISSRDLTYSSAIDAQLTSSQASATYTATWQQIMTTQLNDYKAALRQTYNQTSGKKGRAQMKSDYTQLALLIKQFNQANSAPSN